MRLKILMFFFYLDHHKFLTLKNILYRDGVEMPDEIIEYVARNIKSNVRELEGAIISLIAQSSFNKKEVTLDFALEYIGADELAEVTPKSIRIRKKYLTLNERKKNK